jgi:hypothetical protein
MLKSGGSAADAALTTALTQVALSAGAAVSYAGILTGLYYDANSQTVYSLMRHGTLYRTKKIRSRFQVRRHLAADLFWCPA